MLTKSAQECYANSMSERLWRASLSGFVKLSNLGQSSKWDGSIVKSALTWLSRDMETALAWGRHRLALA
jgi:hypothetical protein